MNTLQGKVAENYIRRIPDTQKLAMVEQHPLRRLSLPDDVAQAAWITGVIFDATGGSVLV